jgi:DNA (cytosine-5)-methyltransferase 1
MKPLISEQYSEVNNHICRKVGADVQKRIDTLKIGQKMQDLPEELWHKSFRYYVKEDPNRKGGPNMRMIRLHPEQPSLTVTGYIFNKFVHPYENRFITVREAARLQGFPDDLRFEGTLTSTQLQVGNAVPVPLARAVFKQISCHATSKGFKHLTAFSLFSGAGGMDIGAEQTEFISPKIALEFDSNACNTLRGYFGKRLHVIEDSILNIANPLETWHTLTGEKKSPDLVFGGPPCQAFSQAGKQKGLDDDRGQLIFEYLRFIENLSPSYFVMENVSNLKGVGGGSLFETIKKKMVDLGYNVSVAPLLASDFGAPQKRVRLFFIGCRKDLGRVDMPEPTHSSIPKLFGEDFYVSVKEAFSGLPEII